MSETAGGSNIEVAHHLGEHPGSSHARAHQLLEIAEAVVLAIVAIATAWEWVSGGALDRTSIRIVRACQQGKSSRVFSFC